MPPEYINKLSQMFKDIKVSNDINDKFKTMARHNLHNNNLAGKSNLAEECFNLASSLDQNCALQTA